MKKIAFYVSIVMMAFCWFVSCQTDDVPDDSNYQFYAALLGDRTDEYWQDMVIDILDRSIVEEIEMPIYTMENSYDTESQLAILQQLNNYKGRLQGMILFPSDRDVEAAAADVVRATGAPLVIIDSPLTENSPLEGLYKAAVMTDNAKEALDLYKEAEKDGHSKILVIHQNASPASVLRYSAISKYKGDNLIDVLVSPNEDSLCNVVMRTVHEYPDLKAAVSLNGSSLNKQLIDSLSANGMDIYTFDYNDVIRDGIEKKLIKCALLQDQAEMAQEAMNALLDDETTEMIIYIPTIVIVPQQ